jgi:hypothetical protein
MNIKKVYTTSKGRFWSLVEASYKANRQKQYGSRLGDPIEYEPIVESFVLVEGDNVFELSKVEVK